MSKELLQQTASLFEDPKKWNAYLELIAQKEQLKNFWFNKLKSELIKYFSTNIETDWLWNANNMNWYLADFGEKSLAIWLEGYTKFSLWSSEVNFDKDEITRLLKTEKYSVLLSAFARIDKQFEGSYQVIENGNFTFGSEYDGEFGIDHLAWYAGNDTNNLATQIIDKVNKIRQDKNLTALLAEICRQTAR
jgi:hypothetical protein